MRRLRNAALLALLAFALVAVLLPTGAVERLELLTLDARYVLGLGRRPPGDEIVVAWIDQESMDYLEQNGVSFPWPREIYAQVLEHLIGVGARAVVFDVLFDQRGNAEDDRVFGDALAQSTGDVLAMKFVEFRDTGRDEEETRGFAARGLGGAAAGIARPARARPRVAAQRARDGSDRLGFVNIRPDADTVFRRYDLLRLWGPRGEAPKAYPSLALAAALASQRRGDRDRRRRWPHRAAGRTTTGRGRTEQSHAAQLPRQRVHLRPGEVRQHPRVDQSDRRW
jgi:adenylate cyclase